MAVNVAAAAHMVLVYHGRAGLYPLQVVVRRVYTRIVDLTAGRGPRLLFSLLFEEST